MKFFLVLALLGLAAASYDHGHGEEGRPEGSYNYKKPFTGKYPYYTKGYTDRRRGSEPTTEPGMIKDFFGVRGRDVNDIIEDHEEPVGGRDHYWDDDVSDTVTEHIIPELCHVTAANCTVYNSFLLDCNTVKELESVSPECRSFKCDVTHYFLEHGADIYADFIRSGSIREAVEVVHRELSASFDALNVCTCGKEFLGAVFRSAPFYNGNVLAYLFDAYDIVHIQRFLRMQDFTSLTKFFDRLINGICAEPGGVRCLDSIFTGLEEVAEIVENTFITDYEEYDEGDKKYQKKQEKRCDALFGPIRAWEKSEIELDLQHGEDEWTQLFNKTSVFTKSFYCEKGCKKQRSVVYPCCMRIMLDDKKMFDALGEFIVSIYRALPLEDFEHRQFAEISRFFLEHYDLDKIYDWTVPEAMRDAFMRTIHAAKYCQLKKPVRCS